MPQTSKQQPSLLRLECFKRAPVLAHGVLYTSLPTARACGRLEFTFPPPSPLLAGRWAPSALRQRRHLKRSRRVCVVLLGPGPKTARPSSPQRVAWPNYGNPQRGGPLRRPCSHQLHMLQWCKEEEWRGTFDGVWPKSNGGSTYLVVRIRVRDRFGARGGGVDRYRRRRRRAS